MLDHVLGDAGLSDVKGETEYTAYRDPAGRWVSAADVEETDDGLRRKGGGAVEAVRIDADRAVKKGDAFVLAESPQVRVDGWPASARARFPTPVAAKASSMPTYDRLGPDDSDCLEDRILPPVQLDEE